MFRHPFADLLELGCSFEKDELSKPLKQRQEDYCIASKLKVCSARSVCDVAFTNPKPGSCRCGPKTRQGLDMTTSNLNPPGQFVHSNHFANTCSVEESSASFRNSISNFEDDREETTSLRHRLHISLLGCTKSSSSRHVELDAGGRSVVADTGQVNMTMHAAFRRGTMFLRDLDKAKQWSLVFRPSMVVF